MRAHLLTIGDEILIGQIVDTNAAWLGETLTALGIRVVRADSIGDDLAGITKAVGEALVSSDLVIVTGGLGPTHDDVTKAAIQDLFGVSSRFDPGVFELVEARFARRGLVMPDRNRSQADIPTGFEPLFNPVGTAPGLWRPADGIHGILVVMPGVPHEMKAITKGEVVPRLAAQGGRGAIFQVTFLTTGIGESSLQEKLGPLDEWLGPDCSMAYLPSIHGVRLRLTGHGGDEAEAERRIVPLRDHVVATTGRWIFGQGDDTLEGCVGRLLEQAGATLGIAESCTGGLIGHRLTNVAGASNYVRGAVVAYDNQVKVDVLGVPEALLTEHGAVSREVAIAMAVGVRRITRADYSLSTTGIMGPGGGTVDKPVGMVWIGVDSRFGETQAVLLRLGTDRVRNKERAATAALDLLRRTLAGHAPDGPAPVI